MLNLITKAITFLGAGGWEDVDPKLQFLENICNTLESLLWPVLIVVASVGSLYAIYLGINMAKAEDASKREEAKKHVINVVIAMAVVIVFILLIQTVIIPNLGTWLEM